MLLKDRNFEKQNSCHTKWGTEMGFGQQQYNGSLIVISTFHASQFERVDPLLRGPQPKCSCKNDMLPSDQDPKDHVKGTFSGIICFALKAYAANYARLASDLR